VTSPRHCADPPLGVTASSVTLISASPEVTDTHPSVRDACTPCAPRAMCDSDNRHGFTPSPMMRSLILGQPRASEHGKGGGGSLLPWPGMTRVGLRWWEGWRCGSISLKASAYKDRLNPLNERT
jgi:hypothetical protein